MLQANTKRVSIGIRREGSPLGSRTCDVVRYRDPPLGSITSSLRTFPTALSRSLLRSRVYMYTLVRRLRLERSITRTSSLGVAAAIVISPGGLYVSYHATSIATAPSFPRIVLAPSPAYPRRFPFIPQQWLQFVRKVLVRYYYTIERL